MSVDRRSCDVDQGRHCWSRGMRVSQRSRCVNQRMQCWLKEAGVLIVEDVVLIRGATVDHRRHGCWSKEMLCWSKMRCWSREAMPVTGNVRIDHRSCSVDQRSTSQRRRRVDCGLHCCQSNKTLCWSQATLLIRGSKSDWSKKTRCWSEEARLINETLVLIKGDAVLVDREAVDKGVAVWSRQP